MKTRLRLFVFILMFFVLLNGFNSVLAESDTSEDDSLLTLEEKQYVENNPVVKAGLIDGSAPFSYKNEDGEIQGVFLYVLNNISGITGLTFEYEIFESIDYALASDCDLIFVITPGGFLESVTLTQPFLESGTILYVHSSFDPGQLDNEIYAAVKGYSLPEGVRIENTVYYDTREASLNAVESGRAAYGAANAFSVVYYKLQYGYKNIITIPIEKEVQKFCIGLLKDDYMLLSVLNKAIGLINPNQTRVIIMDLISKIDRKITAGMIFDTYSSEIAIIFIIVLSILLLSVISNIYVANRLREQSNRYEVLSQISNEYLYEYFPKTQRLNLTDKFYTLFYTQESINEVTSVLKNALSNMDSDYSNLTIKLRMPGGGVGAFKSINLNIYDRRGRIESIMGKLIDISEETAEKEKLMIKAQIDGLTGLYNADTTQNLVNERVKKKDFHQLDAFILMDCDGFKIINDTYGHLVGNKVLRELANVLKNTFRSTDIIGRVGGDEFCIYLKDIPSVDFIHERCYKLSEIIENTIKENNVTVSMGIVLVREKQAYETLFRKADKALYQAKRMGKAQIIFFDENQLFSNAHNMPNN